MVRGGSVITSYGTVDVFQSCVPEYFSTGELLSQLYGTGTTRLSNGDFTRKNMQTRTCAFYFNLLRLVFCVPPQIVRRSRLRGDIGTSHILTLPQLASHCHLPLDVDHITQSF
jgi:hypothetical protein